jgi:hypothetical protein
MKIVSHFLDYYDDVGKKHYPQDISSVEYHRKTEHCSPTQIYHIKEKLFQNKVESIRYFYDKKENWSINFFALGFCGKFYKGVQILTSNDVEVSYTLTGAIYLPSKYGIKTPKEVEENAKNHFNLLNDNVHYDCHEIDEPSFIVLPGGFQDIKIIKNPVLSDLHFHKTKNPYNAFHEIKMFLEKQKEKKAKKKKQSNNIWNFNPFISAFLTIQ